MQAAVEALRQGFTRYTPNAGTLEIRQAICHKLKGVLHNSPSTELLQMDADGVHSVHINKRFEHSSRWERNSLMWAPGCALQRRMVCPTHPMKFWSAMVQNKVSCRL